MLTIFLITLFIIIGLWLLIAYVPSVDEFVRRVSGGQWFIVGAERDGDVLKVNVDAVDETKKHKKDKHDGDGMAKNPNDSTPSAGGPASMSLFDELEKDIESVVSRPLAPEIVNTPEVFLVQDNIYSYEDAEPLCRAYNSRLATMGDLYDAWKKGADWCSYGWVKGHKAVFPTQKTSWVNLQKSEEEQVRTKCGLPGLNGGLIRDPTARFGVHCYGIKPPTWRNYLANTMARENLTAQEMEARSATSKFRKQLNKYTIMPFSKTRWSDIYTTGDDAQMGAV